MSEENIYQQNGYADRDDYLEAMSEEYDIDVDSVHEVAAILGPDEDFDGLISMLEDMG